MRVQDAAIAALADRLAASQHILLISHISPDGDAIGSMLGLKALLQAQGYTVTAANQDGVPKLLRSEAIVPGWQTVVTHAGNASRYDLVITLDCSDLARLGKVYTPALAWLPLVNVDHHITNLNFGAINLVDGEATSCAEVVYRLAQTLDWPLTAAAAQCLLTGIVTDTRGFRISGVSADVLTIAQQLMAAGASLFAVTDGVLERRNIETICLWGEALGALQMEERILWTAIPLAMRRRCNGVEQSDSGLANFLAGADEADAAVIFTEREDGKVDVGMRAAYGFNVAQSALALGGGGHPRAAGCSLAMPLDAAITHVLSVLKPALAQQRLTREVMR